MKRRTISRIVGNHELVAEEYAGGWSVRQVTPGDFAAGLSEAAAVQTLDDLVAAYRKTLRTVKRPRATCALCGRDVAVGRDGTLGWHNEQEPAPGRRQRTCKGTGARAA